MILALDTTHEQGSIALVDQGLILCEHSLDGADGFGHTLFAAIAALPVPLDRIDAFSAACGPGTFTGVRIGLTAVKGLAEATGKPAYGISNLAALLTFARSPRAIPFYDARRGDVYARRLDGEEVVIPLAPRPRIAPPPVEWSSPQNFPGVDLTPAPPLIAGARGRLAEKRVLAGDRPDPATLDANYVRRTDAELNWRDTGALPNRS
ncbi:MAG: tRNA (adenosine(37)-N6)-threonylcarbamoyltransferase complex dimerization subunit type 1 TsaB [Acidobacteriota bacterium]